MSNSLRNRRGFLQLTGAAGAASLAGCNELSLGTDDGGDDGSADGDASITAVVELGPEAQQELLQFEQQLVQQIEEEELDQEAALEELEGRQEELLEGPMDELETRVEGTDALSIDDSMTVQGTAAYRLDGSPDAIIGVLEDGAVNALLPSETFEQVRAQEEGAAGAPPPVEGEEDAGEDGEDDVSEGGDGDEDDADGGDGGADADEEGTGDAEGGEDGENGTDGDE